MFQHLGGSFGGCVFVCPGCRSELLKPVLSQIELWKYSFSPALCQNTEVNYMLPHFASFLCHSSFSGSILGASNFRVWLSSLHTTELHRTPGRVHHYHTSFPQHCNFVFCTFLHQSQKSMRHGDKPKTASFWERWEILGREDLISPPNDAVALFDSLHSRRRKAVSLVRLSHAGLASWFYYVLALRKSLNVTKPQFFSSLQWGSWQWQGTCLVDLSRGLN